MKKIILLLVLSMLVFGCAQAPVEETEEIEEVEEVEEAADEEVEETTEDETEEVEETPDEETEEETPEEPEAEESKNTMVLLETSMGDIKIQLFDDLVPITAGNFKKLVEEGFYDGIIFHRVIADFMLQGGDPEGTGRGGPGYKIEDEFVDDLRHDRKGLLSMANSGPNTGGSQFFITLVPTPWLDDKHAIFGEVIEGIDVVDAIGAVDTGAMDKPKEDVVINKASVVE
jgi:peptidyl-prolyl cis-trans isomerase A (cyclophilin A)